MASETAGEGGGVEVKTYVLLFQQMVVEHGYLVSNRLGMSPQTVVFRAKNDDYAERRAEEILKLPDNGRPARLFEVGRRLKFFPSQKKVPR